MKIIFEDKNILVVDKPQGLVVHSDGRTEEETLVDFLELQYPELENVGNPHTLDSGRYSTRWGIVNRLDRDTSGLILIAKDEETFFDLQKQWQEHKVKKIYTAKVWGEVEGKFEVDEPLSRHKKDPRLWVCGTGVGERNTKREAKTILEAIRYHKGKNQTELSLVPITGRTHQLRLHCRFIGHPIVGDTKYGIQGLANEYSKKQIEKLLGTLKDEDFEVDTNSKLELRAKALEFTHPVSKKKMVISTD
jgi:23S rRNA pseudouridine1911/1915/1917 synthase